MYPLRALMAKLLCSSFTHGKSYISGARVFLNQILSHSLPPSCLRKLASSASPIEPAESWTPAFAGVTNGGGCVEDSADDEFLILSCRYVRLHYFCALATQCLAFARKAPSRARFCQPPSMAPCRSKPSRRWASARIRRSLTHVLPPSSSKLMTALKSAGLSASP